MCGAEERTMMQSRARADAIAVALSSSTSKTIERSVGAHDA